MSAVLEEETAAAVFSALERGCIQCISGERSEGVVPCFMHACMHAVAVATHANCGNAHAFIGTFTGARANTSQRRAYCRLAIAFLCLGERRFIPINRACDVSGLQDAYPLYIP